MRDNKLVATLVTIPTLIAWIGFAVLVVLSCRGPLTWQGGIILAVIVVVAW